MKNVSLQSLILILIFFNQCIPQQKTQIIKSGILKYGPKFFDTASSTYKTPKNHETGRIWFKDSLVIYEELLLESFTKHTPTQTTRSQSFVVDSYLFFDLRTGYQYSYSSFTDTAKLVKSKFLSKDSATENLWLIFGYKEDKYAIPDSTIVLMSDTIIGKVQYKRFSGYNYKNNSANTQKIYYCSCNSFNPLFQIDANTSKKFCNGFPIQRQEFYGLYKTYFVAEFELLQSGLTAEEEKVFNAWEKYAKEHPIKQK